MKGKFFLCAALTGLLFSSCNKDDDSPGAITTEDAGIGYQLKVINPTVDINQNPAFNSAIQWTSGFANPREIKFEAKPAGNNGHGNGNGNGHKDKIEYKSTNTAQIDLFAPVSTIFGAFSLPPGEYKEVELKMKLDKNGPAPALQLNGIYSSNTIPSLPVTVLVEDVSEIKTEVKNVTIDDNTTFNAITSLDLADLTNGITDQMIQNAELTNGVLVISPTSNENLYDIIVDNLRNKRHGCEVRKKNK